MPKECDDKILHEALRALRLAEQDLAPSVKDHPFEPISLRSTRVAIANISEKLHGDRDITDKAVEFHTTKTIHETIGPDFDRGWYGDFIAAAHRIYSTYHEFLEMHKASKKRFRFHLMLHLEPIIDEDQEGFEEEPVTDSSPDILNTEGARLWNK